MRTNVSWADNNRQKKMNTIMINFQLLEIQAYIDSYKKHSERRPLPQQLSPHHLETSDGVPVYPKIYTLVCNPIADIS